MRNTVPKERETSGRIWGGYGKSASPGWLKEMLLAPVSPAGNESKVTSSWSTAQPEAPSPG